MKSTRNTPHRNAATAIAIAATVLAVQMPGASPNAFAQKVKLDALPKAAPLSGTQLKYASKYKYLDETFTIVGLDSSHTIYKNSSGDFFYFDPKTGDMNILKKDFYKKLIPAVHATTGHAPALKLKLNEIKYGNPVTVMGIDSLGNVVQKNKRGEEFYVDPANGDMIMVKY